MGLRTWLGLKKTKKKREKRPPPPAARIRIFHADPMSRTLFAADRRICTEFKQIGVGYVSDPDAADIIVARWPAALAPYGHLDRKFLIFTHEPRYAFIEGAINYVEGVRNPVHLMTAYNGLVYADHFYCGPKIEVEFDERMRAFKAKPRRTVMLATYKRNTTLVRNGVNIDLYQRRQELALLLHRDGECDLYGRNWPEEVQVAGSSRDKGWQDAKQGVLKGYKINIAFENTLIPLYITEKPWDAIAGACLPVYHGVGTGIYDVMPQGCFIEAADRSIEDLKNIILSMPDDEMADRYEIGLRRYKELADTQPFRISHHKSRERAVRLLLGMMK